MCYGARRLGKEHVVRRLIRITRRELVRGMLPAAFAWTTDIGGTATLRVDSAETNWGAAPLEPRGMLADDVKGIAGDLFVKGATRVSGILADPNWIYDDERQVNKGSRAAKDSFVKWLGINNFLISEDRLSVLPDGLVVLFGGPKTNVYSRAILGTGRGSPLIRALWPDESAILPFMFDLENPLEGREGGEQGWRVLCDGEPDDSLNDCLIMTSIPNPYSASEETGDRILVFAARHRAGMIAAEYIFRNPKLLSRLENITRRWRAWQALIPIETDDLQTPRAIGPERVAPLAMFDRAQERLKGLPFLSNPDIGQFSAFAGLALQYAPEAHIGEFDRVGKFKSESVAIEASGSKISVRSAVHSRSKSRVSMSAPISETESMETSAKRGDMEKRSLNELEAELQEAMDEGLKRLRTTIPPIPLTRDDLDFISGSLFEVHIK